jgi:hypothetical protein
MSFLPIYSFPGGSPMPVPNTSENITYKWIDSLGGGILSGPVTYGTINPNGVPAVVGIATSSPTGHVIIEYHYSQNYY